MTISRLTAMICAAAFVAGCLSGCSAQVVAASSPDPRCFDQLTPGAEERLRSDHAEVEAAWPAEVPNLPTSVFAQLFVATSGVSCQWNGDSGTVIYSSVQADADARDAARRTLTALEYDARTVSWGTLFISGEGDDALRFAVTADGVFGATGAGDFDDISLFRSELG
ncbi:hypothetical protein SCB71_20440 [Herbiconiux sp. KACC 21604]|uniref:hypothetical protein n=1 Tax=unclassified Herbiconiux TaxID=2618217 RepID=UPI0014919713|nr:hypothetical protein [Herbiconiux sp. SALV-R1]QJU55392.1 hypothetical protein HL652_18365 [Herbiconiux sp. SALV-R1]WPO86565.1 hypothetical protein SCB71_20440 [Herbiconiux sp. KACC 21604]